jgi:hypothetical protein
MSVDTKGVVVTSCKEIFFVCALVERALTQYIAPKARKEHASARKGSEPEWTLPTIRLSSAGELVQFHFRFNGEQRILWLFFTCDCDNLELGEQSLSLNLGYWGSSETIMRIVLEALACLGPTYIDVNDCDDVDKVPTGYQRFGFQEAAARGLVHDAGADDWRSQAQAGHVLPYDATQPA